MEGNYELQHGLLFLQNTQPVDPFTMWSRLIFSVIFKTNIVRRLRKMHCLTHGLLKMTCTFFSHWVILMNSLSETMVCTIFSTFSEDFERKFGYGITQLSGYISWWSETIPNETYMRQSKWQTLMTFFCDTRYTVHTYTLFLGGFSLAKCSLTNKMLPLKRTRFYLWQFYHMIASMRTFVLYWVNHY